MMGDFQDDLELMWNASRCCCLFVCVLFVCRLWLLLFEVEWMGVIWRGSNAASLGCSVSHISNTVQSAGNGVAAMHVIPRTAAGV